MAELAGLAGLAAAAEPRDVAEIRAVCGRFHTAIELIGTKWTGAVLRALFTGQRRYGEIKAAVPGVSDTMLAQRLRAMREQGLIERTVAATTPVQIEYRLTEMGLALEPVLAAVIAWSHDWISVPPGAINGE